ncbi:MAG: prepilin-type N-terminal cleavage/methylation domain-containing protein [Candidatus Paceibacterota bacterium]|jgi:type II secretion system protein H
MKNNQQGFTLIEMLVVVAIVGLLSSVVVVGLGGARSKARDAKRIAEVQTILNWAELNYTNAGYPSSSAVLPVSFDPQGKAYVYVRDAADDQKAAAGICLENSESATGATDCPAGWVACTVPANAYCKKVTGQ